jgi:hypothetical protein
MRTTKQLSTSELMYLLDRMEYYSMSSGYVGETRDGKIDFTDQEDCSSGNLHVTREELQKLLNQKLSEE